MNPDATISFPMFGEGFILNLPRFFTVFGFNIYFYGLFITTGYVLAGVYLIKRRSLFGLTKDNILDLVIIAILCGLVGARLYYCIFNPSSLNTVRCITFYTKNGVVAPPYLSFFRTGRRGSFVDNASKGGIACGIDSVSGRLATDAYAQYYGERYACHPDSGIQFKGYQLPEWEKLLGMCKEMSAQLPSVKFISWDMAHADKDGWVVVEGNSHGAIDFQQLFWNRGLKADIEEIVRNTETIM